MALFHAWTCEGEKFFICNLKIIFRLVKSKSEHKATQPNCGIFRKNIVYEDLIQYVLMV